MAGKSNERFKTGDLVFAKMKGFPHWPARVRHKRGNLTPRVLVYFFGTHQIGSLVPENVVPYVGNKMKYGTGVRIKGFSEGMWEIQNTPGIGSKLKVSVYSMQNLQPQFQKSYCVSMFLHVVIIDNYDNNVIHYVRYYSNSLLLLVQ
uniref:PWWP domain-containing protein n=1 Tax=Sphaeramia orbicularis TaxID=375764 RepID=A0A672ZBT8_9TELE